MREISLPNKVHSDLSVPPATPVAKYITAKDVCNVSTSNPPPLPRSPSPDRNPQTPSCFVLAACRGTGAPRLAHGTDGAEEIAVILFRCRSSCRGIWRQGEGGEGEG